MRRLITYVGALFVALELLYLGVLWRSETPQKKIFTPSSGGLPQAQKPLSEVVRSFLEDIRDLHPSKGHGNVPHLDRARNKVDIFKLQDKREPLTIEFLQQFLEVPDEWRHTLRQQHAKVVEKIPHVPVHALEGQGIVLTGGGKLFGQALVAIRYMLDYHAGFPIELWMARDEYEPEYCEKIFPQHNVSCIVMEDFYGEQVNGFDYMGYPLKSLALAGSRFKDVYFTDVDSFPLGSIRDLFESEPYKETGFISWPDYWYRLSAPEYYDIAGLIDLKSTNPKTMMVDLPNAVLYNTSSETGQIVYDKSRQWDSILLSAYYNLNGNNYYYPLLSQAPENPGFGDKETFISAASVLGHRVYQVSEWVNTLGYFVDEEGKSFHGSGMVQRDPIMDYEKHRRNGTAKVGAFSLHCNNMKLDPFFVFSTEEDVHWAKPNQAKNKRRSLGGIESVMREIGYDVELRLYEVVQNVICDWIVQTKPVHSSNEDMVRTCELAKEHVEWLRQSTI